jgi:hypothetical protein
MEKLTVSCWGVFLHECLVHNNPAANGRTKVLKSYVEPQRTNCKSEFVNVFASMADALFLGVSGPVFRSIQRPSLLAEILYGPVRGTLKKEQESSSSSQGKRPLLNRSSVP